ncbi:acyltransferase [Aeromonas media]|uniref:Acyltransferase n=1 Tax=Aeromonas media TaxID=651 RepID=A0AAE7ALP7_AERME|nr:acyltransferase [Aeromonas media]QJT32485.1 acyltransferase [Aeromonas media]QJT33032.1 acyltransferase [Aeromonas media]QJT38614.1 acyltransferase [Aeromonas media]
MPSLLPGPLVLFISTSMTILFTALCASLILLVSLVKLLLPIPAFGRACSRLNNGFMRLWLACNALVISLTTRIDWQVEDDTRLRKDGWYLIISNHMSWTDIVVLGHLFRDRLPVPKFFMKHELIYIPLLGLACWGLDMPFMRRYSREFLLRNPHLRGKDIETTRHACEKFRHIPTTVINFVEGTRFTEEKREATRYQHLMPPKAAGLAFTLAAMGEQFDSLINVTISYPDNAEAPFKDFLMGRMKRIRVRIEELPVDGQLVGDYFNDKQFKRGFQAWLNQRWQEKDEVLEGWQQAQAPVSLTAKESADASSGS